MVFDPGPAFLRREAALYRSLMRATTDDRTRRFLYQWITREDAAGRDHADQRMAANEIALNVGRLLP
jgi:hypothetical protein